MLKKVYLALDSFRCLYCGNRPSSDPDCKLVLDHVHPFSLGGKGVVSNIVTACSRCNGFKHAKLLDEPVLADITSYLDRVNTAGGFNPDGTIEGVAL